MNKEIEKAQKNLNDAKMNREIKKVRYDSQLLILDGHRKGLVELENMNQNLMKEYSESDRVVDEMSKRLQEAVTKQHEENESE